MKAAMLINPRWSVAARMDDRRDLYAINVSVNLPPTFWPLVKLNPNQIFPPDDAFDPLELERFLRETTRIGDEHQQILETLAREWRLPTPAEQERINVLVGEFEMRTAELLRTIAVVQ